jgi:disulfide bond formation protein DsbB
MEEWTPSPVSLRGRWSLEKPALGGLAADPGRGPLTNLRPLGMKRRIRLGLPLQGSPTDLAYEAAGDRFALTTQHGIYITNGALDRVLRYTVVDPGFSVDLGRFAGAAFLDSHTIMALSENKSYVILRESDHADAGKNFRFFLESFDSFEELSRSRFATIRARMMYVMSLAYDPVSDSLYTITVPNARTRKLVFSRFDRKDLTLSEEFIPTISSESGLVRRDGGQSLEEYYLTGAAIVDGRLYAVSPAYSTLLCVDLAGRSVIAAYTLDGIERAIGIAVRSGEIFIVGEHRVVFVFDKPD